MARPDFNMKDNKPLPEFRQFAHKLGWRGFRLWQHAVEDDGSKITWYVAGKAEGEEPSTAAAHAAAGMYREPR